MPATALLATLVQLGSWMMESNTNDRLEPASYSITIDGLMRHSGFKVENPKLSTITLEFGGDEPISRIWSKLKGKRCGLSCALQ